MLILNDYRCPKGHITEHLVEPGSHVRCDCGLQAHRIISPVNCQLDPISGHFPGATMKWIKEHERGANASE